jgi:hypothetical protein
VRRFDAVAAMQAAILAGRPLHHSEYLSPDVAMTLPGDTGFYVNDGPIDDLEHARRLATFVVRRGLAGVLEQLGERPPAAGDEPVPGEPRWTSELRRRYGR